MVWHGAGRLALLDGRWSNFILVRLKKIKYLNRISFVPGKIRERTLFHDENIRNLIEIRNTK